MTGSLSDDAEKTDPNRLIPQSEGFSSTGILLPSKG